MEVRPLLLKLVIVPWLQSCQYPLHIWQYPVRDKVSITYETNSTSMCHVRITPLFGCSDSKIVLVSSNSWRTIRRAHWIQSADCYMCKCLEAFFLAVLFLIASLVLCVDVEDSSAVMAFSYSFVMSVRDFTHRFGSMTLAFSKLGTPCD